MDSKQIKQRDAESLLANTVFMEAIAEYRKTLDEAALVCKTPEEAFRIVLAKQAAELFLAEINKFINDGVVSTYQEMMESKENFKPVFNRGH